MEADATREPVFNAAESETPRMCGNSPRGNRESQQVSSHDGGGERSGKAAGRTPDMHAGGQSDDSIVPRKRANKAGPEGGCGVRGGKGIDQGKHRSNLTRAGRSAGKAWHRIEGCTRDREVESEDSRSRRSSSTRGRSRMR